MTCLTFFARHCLVAALALVLAIHWLYACPALGQSSPPAAQHPPQWIWSDDASGGTHASAKPGGMYRFEQSFEVELMMKSAVVRAAADFCEVQIAINGHNVISMEPYSPAVDSDVKSLLRRGRNHIEILARGVGGPAAVALILSLSLADGRHVEIATDREWRVTEAGREGRFVRTLGLVEPALWGTGRRPTSIDPFDNYEQWRQAIGTSATNSQAAFWTAPGFAISLVRQALLSEGSWVSMAFDPQGRLTIGREDKGLLRMTLDETTLEGHAREVTKVESINSDLAECRGLLYAYDALYANANNSKGLYRLRDTDGDDQFDEVRLLRSFPGNVGHGRNDLTLGPDGLIYSIHGDAVDVPRDDIVDYTSPFREARRGKNTREGHLVRTDRDCKQWELVAAGLRNPYGIAFNQRGDLFTYDADAEFDMGSPWYRPTRINHLASGMDFGWRGVTGKWPPYFPDHADNAPPTLDIGKGSPTAVAFGTQTHFPPDYRRALFVLDWAYGRVLAVHLAPRGAGYRAHAETFLKGRPLNVTDLAVGHDGGLYIITGGRKTQSALYRVTYTGEPGAEPLPSAHELACRVHADRMRQLRLELEQRHRRLGQDAVDFAWPHVDSPDPLVRFAARTAVEHQPLEIWRERAVAHAQLTGSVGPLLALARSGDKVATDNAVEQLTRITTADLSLTQLQMLVQAYFVCLDQAREKVMERKDAILRQLEPVFPLPSAICPAIGPAGTDAALLRDLARLMDELGSPTIVAKVSQRLLGSPAQEDRLQGLFVLRNVSVGWTNETRRAYFTALNEAAQSVGGEGMPKFVAQIREEAVATLSDNERRQLVGLLEAPPVEDAEPLPPQRPLVKHWGSDDLLPLLDDQRWAGDPTRGEVVFREALCARCHRAGARGPAVGPDLTHVAGRFSRPDILESILSPSKVVAENYRNVQISTADGRQIVGRVVAEGDYRSEKIRLATDPLQPSAISEISKREIEQVRETETSPMPQGLLDSFQPQDIVDLLAFLTQIKAP